MMKRGNIMLSRLISFYCNANAIPRWYCFGKANEMTTQVVTTATIGHNSQANDSVNELQAILDQVKTLNRGFKKAKEDKERRATKAATLFQMVWQYADKVNDLNAIRVFCQESDEFGKVAAKIFNAVYESHVIGVEKGNFYLAHVLDENGKRLHRRQRFDLDMKADVMAFNGRIDKILRECNLVPDEVKSESQLAQEAKDRAKKDALAIKNGKLPVSVYLVALKAQLESLGVKA